MPIPVFLAEQDSTRIYQIGRTGFDSGDADASDYSTEFTDDASGAAAAPDEGLLAGAFIARSGGVYTSGSPNVRKFYTTEFYSNNFHYAGDIQRPPDDDIMGRAGIGFLCRDENNMCSIYIYYVDATHVDIRFVRYDGGFQDPVTLEFNFPLAAEEWVRFGVRVVDSVVTGYRADAVTGSNEVSLGEISLSAAWVDNDDHRHVGVANFLTNASRATWDNLTLERVFAGTAYTGIIKSERITPFQSGGIFQPSAGEFGLAHFRRVGIRILHTGGFTITVTAWVDGVQTQYYDSDGDLQDQTIEFTESAPTSNDPVESLLEADISAKGTYIEVQISVDSTDVTGIFLPESIEVHARPLRRARRGTDSESQ